jgi:hypothetical protein
MSQNLLAPDSNMPTPISVADNDVNSGLPEDLTADTDLPFWKQPNMKIWIYVLGGSIAVFAIIFVLLSQQSSLFKGSTIDTTAIGGDQELFFGEYGDNTAASTPTATTTTSTDDQAIVGSTTTTTTTTTPASTTDADNNELIIDDSLAFDPADVAPTFTDVIPEVYDEFSEVEPNASIEEDLFGAGYNDAGELAYVEEVIAEPSLVTNTSASVMQAPGVQGNTGPGLWLSLCPTLLFIGYRFARKQV